MGDSSCETDTEHISQVSLQSQETTETVVEEIIDRNLSVEEIEENEWLSCGMVACQKPTKKNLKWVKCDVCHEWIHAICVNLDETVDMEDNFFACPPCWRPIQPLTEEDNNSESDSGNEEGKDLVAEFDFKGFENLDPINGRRTRKAAENCRNDLIRKIKSGQL